jgi:hypothetical protein
MLDPVVKHRTDIRAKDNCGHIWLCHPCTFHFLLVDLNNNNHSNNVLCYFKSRE